MNISLPARLSISRIITITIGWVALTTIGSSVYGQGLGFQGDLISVSDGSRTAQVYSVARGGIAQRLGVRPGDTILTVNNYWPGNSAWNRRAINAGQGTVTIVVKRHGRMMTLSGNHVAGNGTQRRNSGLRKRLVGNWWTLTNGKLNRVALSANGKLHIQQYNKLTKQPISGMNMSGRWKVNGETLVYFLNGKKTSAEIISATRAELDMVNLATNASFTLLRNL